MQRNFTQNPEGVYIKDLIDIVEGKRESKSHPAHGTRQESNPRLKKSAKPVRVQTYWSIIGCYLSKAAYLLSVPTRVTMPHSLQIVYF
jgi:hypothetical protein